jgi:hypothetical protein
MEQTKARNDEAGVSLPGYKRYTIHWAVLTRLICTATAIRDVCEADPEYMARPLDIKPKDPAPHIEAEKGASLGGITSSEMQADGPQSAGESAPSNLQQAGPGPPRTAEGPTPVAMQAFLEALEEYSVTAVVKKLLALFHNVHILGD